MRGVTAAAVVLVVSLSAPPVGAQVRDVHAVTGEVVSTDGTRVAGARVTVEARITGRRWLVVTDAEGRFAARVDESPTGYAVTAAADGYTRTTRSLAPAELAGRVPVQLVLTPAVVPLRPLTVTGMNEAALRGIGGATHVLDPAALRQHRPAAAHDLLRQTTGVHVQDEDALGLHLNIGMRGLDPRRSTRVLLLEDGVPIHLGPYTDPSVHYQPPAEVLQRIEVLKGSGQVGYGPQTVGGVINFMRRPPPRTAGGAIMLRAGDRGRRTGHILVGTGIGDHALSLSIGRRQAEGPRRGAHHEVDDVAGQVLLELSAAGSLLLKGGAYTERSRWGETGLTLAEFQEDPFGNPSPGDIFELRRFAGQALYEHVLDHDARLSVVLYGQDTHRASWRQASSSADRFGQDGYAARFGCPDDARDMSGCGFQGRPRDYTFSGVESRLHRRLAGSHTLDAGLRFHGERAERRQFLGTTPSKAGAELLRDNVLTAQAVAAFVQAGIAIDAWTVTPGLRLERVRTANRNRLRELEDRATHTVWLPGLGVTREAGARTTLFLGAHRGFAPPRPGDVLSPQPGQSIVQVDPELSWNYEAGVRTRLLPAIGVEATLFRIDFENQIVEGGRIGAGQRFVNAGTTVHQGIELFGRLDNAGTRAVWPLASLGYTLVQRAAYTSDQTSVVDGVTPVRGRRLPFAPRHLLHGSAGIATRGGSEITLRASHVSEQFADDLNTRAPTDDGQRGVLPAHTVFGMTANQRIARSGATLFLTADNLRNSVYITERLEGIMVGPPRRFTLGMEWLFQWR